MAERPYTVLSCAISLDGFLDDASPERLRLSGPADLDRVDAVRARSDAILVGAATVRNDDPRLVVRNAERRAARIARGLAPSPVKVTVSEHVKLEPTAAFFTTGESERFVYCPTGRLDEARDLLGHVATVADGGEERSMRHLVEDLRARGVRRLLVEGGATVHTQFLTQGLADELHLAIAPIFVGDAHARRWVDDGCYPWQAGVRGRLVDTRTLDDVVVLRYALSDRFDPEHRADDWGAAVEE
jgi:5-amino-6-(5-phosphoribosylamino)uracil reductase